MNIAIRSKPNPKAVAVPDPRTRLPADRHYSATDLFALNWMGDRDRVALRRMLPTADAAELLYKRTPLLVADALRLASVERLYGRLSDHGYRALVCVLADLLSEERP